MTVRHDFRSTTGLGWPAQGGAVCRTGQQSMSLARPSGRLRFPETTGQCGPGYRSLRRAKCGPRAPAIHHRPLGAPSDRDADADSRHSTPASCWARTLWLALPPWGSICLRLPPPSASPWPMFGLFLLHPGLRRPGSTSAAPAEGARGADRLGLFRLRRPALHGLVLSWHLRLAMPRRLPVPVAVGSSCSCLFRWPGGSPGGPDASGGLVAWRCLALPWAFSERWTGWPWTRHSSVGSSGTICNPSP